MAAFEDEQIEQFIRNWFPIAPTAAPAVEPATDPAAEQAADQAAEQCWKLLQSPDYAAAKELAQTPLLLTLLCAVYRSYRDFPKNRAQLYGEALDVLLREWAAEKRIHDEPIFDTPRRERTGILGSTKPLKLDTLQFLAQRWDSPQATSGMPYPSWISPSSFLG